MRQMRQITVNGWKNLEVNFWNSNFLFICKECRWGELYKYIARNCFNPTIPVSEKNAFSSSQESTTLCAFNCRSFRSFGFSAIEKCKWNCKNSLTQDVLSDNRKFVIIKRIYSFYPYMNRNCFVPLANIRVRIYGFVWISNVYKLAAPNRFAIIVRYISKVVKRNRCIVYIWICHRNGLGVIYVSVKSHWMASMCCRMFAMTP